MLYTSIFLTFLNYVNKHAIPFLCTGVKQQIKKKYMLHPHSALLLVVYNCKQYQHLYKEGKLKMGLSIFSVRKNKIILCHILNSEASFYSLDKSD